MITDRTDPELGLHLTTLRALQWIFGSQGDPYALVLRAEGEDPDALRQRVRERSPLHRSRSGAWVTGNHRLGARILADERLEPRHPDVVGPQEHPIRDGVWDRPMCHVLPLEGAALNLSRAEYARLAGLTSAALGAAVLDRYRADLARIPDELLDRLGPGFDLMTDFARPVAVTGVGRLLGLPARRHGHLAELCAALGPALDATLCPPRLRVARDLDTAIRAARELLTGLIGQRRQNPDDDLVSVLIAAAGARDGTVPDTALADVLAVSLLTVAVGVEVAANLVGKATAALLHRPEQWALIRTEPERAAAAVEETLRFDPPVRLAALIARQDIELAGQHVTADSQVVVLIDVANRDPEAYPAPDVFDLERTPEPAPLTLAPGLPAGVVAPVIRALATEAVRALVSRPQLRPAGEPPLRRLRSPVVHGLLRFPVTSG